MYYETNTLREKPQKQKLKNILNINTHMIEFPSVSLTDDISLLILHGNYYPEFAVIILTHLVSYFSYIYNSQLHKQMVEG